MVHGRAVDSDIRASAFLLPRELFSLVNIGRVKSKSSKRRISSSTPEMVRIRTLGQVR